MDKDKKLYDLAFQIFEKPYVQRRIDVSLRKDCILLNEYATGKKVKLQRDFNFVDNIYFSQEQRDLLQAIYYLLSKGIKVNGEICSQQYKHYIILCENSEEELI